MPEPLHTRVVAQLKLALLSDCGCHETLTRLEHEARQSGLTGAEIDAAIGGRSFEARTAAVVAFACAIKAGDDKGLEQARTHALQIGISTDELRTISKEAKRILASKRR